MDSTAVHPNRLSNGSAHQPGKPADICIVLLCTSVLLFWLLWFSLLCISFDVFRLPGWLCSCVWYTVYAFLSLNLLIFRFSKFKIILLSTRTSNSVNLGISKSKNCNLPPVTGASGQRGQPKGLLSSFLLFLLLHLNGSLHRRFWSMKPITFGNRSPVMHSVSFTAPWDALNFKV